jgi:hypothetical protein
MRAGGEGDPLREVLEANLEGKYRVVRLIGAGGMGAVYLARDLMLDREIAIKIVNQTSDDPEMHLRLREEARTAARLSHPNIVPLHAFGEVEGMPYFVMGYVRGESLADRLFRDGRLGEDEAQRILAEVADALDHAHRHGIAHRDVKPDNVLLDDETGRALLTDFGVARAIAPGDDLEGEVSGTPQYMAPEQAAGDNRIDGRSDIYSLGVMAYAMLSGRPPFEGSRADLLAKHQTQDPVPLRSVAPMVSDAVARIVERCLAKDPAARWPDARALKRTLGATDESHLPAVAQNFESAGTHGLVFILAYFYFASFIDHLSGAASDPDLIAMRFHLIWYPIVPLIVVGFFFYALTKVLKEGFSTREALAILWREPSWWPSWYPAPLRRRGNVWRRLPASVRRYRLSPFAILVVGAALYLIGISNGRFFIVQFHPVAFAISMLSITGAVGVTFVLSARARRELAARGLDGADISRVMLGAPPSRVAFWSRPHIAAILSSSASEIAVAR